MPYRLLNVAKCIFGSGKSGVHTAGEAADGLLDAVFDEA